MPGLFGCLLPPNYSTDAIERDLNTMASALRHLPGERLDTYVDRDGRFAVGRIGMAHVNTHKWPLPGSEAPVFAAGHPSVDPDGRLGGTYAALVIDATGQPILQADRTGVIPLYYLMRGGTLFFAPETAPLLALPGTRREVDTGALGMFLGSGKLALGRTLHATIRRLCGGERLRLTTSGPAIETYWRYAPGMNGIRSDSSKALAEEFAALLTDCVARIYDDPARTVLFLSGGADSRALLAAALASPNLSPDQIRTVTWADHSDSAAGDVGVARRIAAATGVRHEVIFRDRTDFAGKFIRANRLLGGAQMAIDHPSEIDVMATLAQRGIERTLRGDASLTDRPLPFSLEQAYRPQAFVALRDLPILVELLAPAMRERIIADNDSLMMDFADRYSGMSFASAKDAIFIEGYTAGYLFKSNYWRNLYFREHLPLLDDRLFDLLQQTPDELRLGKKLFFDALRLLWKNKPPVAFASKVELYGFGQMMTNDPAFGAYVGAQFDDEDSGIWRYIDRSQAKAVLHAALSTPRYKSTLLKTALRGARDLMATLDQRRTRDLSMRMKRATINIVKLATTILVLKDWYDTEIENRPVDTAVPANYTNPH